MNQGDIFKICSVKRKEVFGINLFHYPEWGKVLLLALSEDIAALKKDWTEASFSAVFTYNILIEEGEWVKVDTATLAEDFEPIVKKGFASYKGTKKIESHLKIEIPDARITGTGLVAEHIDGILDNKLSPFDRLSQRLLATLIKQYKTRSEINKKLEALEPSLKKPGPDSMFDDGKWVVMQGEYDGKPIIVRLNNALKQFAGNCEHNLKIGLAIPLKKPNPRGMPDPRENEELAIVEDKILEVLKEQGSVVQALTITMGTFKEFVYYAKPGLNVKVVHETLMREIQSHEVQCTARIEKDWATFHEWANA